MISRKILFADACLFFNELRLNGQGGYLSAGVGGAYILTTFGLKIIQLGLMTRSRKIKMSRRRITRTIIALFHHFNATYPNNPLFEAANIPIIQDLDFNVANITFTEILVGGIALQRSYCFMHGITRILLMTICPIEGLSRLDFDDGINGFVGLNMNAVKDWFIQRGILQSISLTTTRAALLNRLNIMSEVDFQHQFWTELNHIQNEPPQVFYFKEFVNMMTRLYRFGCRNTIGQLQQPLLQFINASIGLNIQFRMRTLRGDTLPSWLNFVLTCARISVPDPAMMQSPAFFFSVVGAEFLKEVVRRFDGTNVNLHMPGSLTSYVRLQEAFNSLRNGLPTGIPNEFSALSRHPNVYII